MCITKFRELLNLTQETRQIMVKLMSLILLITILQRKHNLRKCDTCINNESNN